MCPDSRRKLQPQDPKCYHLTMSTEEHITQLTAQITTLQAQLAHRSWSPPPPPKPPKVSAPSPFSGVQEAIQVPRQAQQCPVHLVIHEGRICRPLGYAEKQ